LPYGQKAFDCRVNSALRSKPRLILELILSLIYIEKIGQQITDIIPIIGVTIR